ncbi:SPFH domain-containing protein [Neorhodopirellula lusitana]|uniref:SPFH domain-containing protein n=1 Tax=Neorhodopirellula lusitana TaxID=445327 RepID=UPI00384FCC31
MSSVIQDNRWSVSDSQFAVRVNIPDLEGFFAKLPVIGSVPDAKTLIIEPGTVAGIVDDGFFVGQLSAGTYTLETFLERLQFWKKKQATVILTRAEEIPLETQVAQVPTREGFCVDLDFRWAIQIRDIMQLVTNLMGARDELSVPEITRLLSPMVTQAVFATIGQLSYDETKLLDLPVRLKDGLALQLDSKFNRYGLDLVDVQRASISSDADQLTERQGENWLKSRELRIQEAATSIEHQELRQKADAVRNRAVAQSTLRDAISEGQLSELKSKEEFQQAVFAIDKGRVLREEEVEELKETFDQNKEDRSAVRQHLLTTLDLQREQEISELRVEIDHAVRMKGLEAEAAISSQSRSQQAAAWQHEIEKQQAAANHRREQKLETVRQQLSRAREVKRQQREDSYEDIVQQQRNDEVKADIEYAQAKRRNELAFSQEELNTRLAAEKLEVQKRQQEWEIEVGDKKSVSQLERLQKVQTMNAQFAERQQKMQVDLELLKEDAVARRELDRISAISDLSTDAMIALAGTDNAALLADLKKHEATQDTVKTTSSTGTAAELNEERLRMYERMNETERAKADAIAEAYKLAMQSQQGNVNQMIGGLSQASTTQAWVVPQMPASSQGPQVQSGAQVQSVPPGQSVGHGQPGPPALPSAQIWYISLNGSQSPPLKIEQVQQYAASGQLTASSMVWTEGMAQWAPAHEVPAIANVLGTATPPPMPPGPPPA